MSRYVWCRLLAGVFFVVCAPVFALVETDNPLLGVLKQEDYTVIQDIGVLHVQKMDLPTLEIRDGVDGSAYDVSSKLNTMLFSGTHKRGLERFARKRADDWDGFTLEADPEARFLIVRWPMRTSRDAAVYRQQLEEWRSKITALNHSVYQTLEAWGPDPVATPTPTPRPEPRDGEVKVVDLGGGVKLELVWVEPGTFMMGSPRSEQRRGENEAQHRVALTKGYWMGKYEVTQEQWETVMGRNPSRFRGAKNPVENVNWNDCQVFIKKLNARIPGGGFRLPTEAEWEFAARGGNRSHGYIYSGGNDINAVAWYYGNSGKRTHEVGQKAANELGLHDMSGNVWEWCADRYGDYSVLAQTDPVGPSSASYRVLRGGGWSFSAGSCRSAYRSWFGPDGAADFAGFRVCLAPGP